MSEIWDLCGELNAIALEMRQLRNSEGHAVVDLPKKKLAAYQAVNAKYRDLHNIYGEMKLDFGHPNLPST